MNDLNIVRKTGWFGLAGFAVFFIELFLGMLPGAQPLIGDAIGRSQFLTENRVLVLSWILLDMMMYVSLLVFFAGFRHLIVKKNPDYEWVATLALVTGAVWWAVSLVADGLEGGAVLDTVGTPDLGVIRALEEATLIIWNGAIAFAVTGFFMALAGYAILGTGALPRWVGWFAWVSAILCALSIPAMFVGSMDHNQFYSPVGWGPMIVANVPPLIWFLVASIFMIRKSQIYTEKPQAVMTPTI
jgi:hypothetical protein